MIFCLNTGIKRNHLLRDICTIWTIPFLHGATLRQLHPQESHQAKSSQCRETSLRQASPMSSWAVVAFTTVSKGRKLQEKVVNDVDRKQNMLGKSLVGVRGTLTFISVEIGLLLVF